MEVRRVELCFLCERIKEIRVKQGKDYLNDLCPECKEKAIKELGNESKVNIISRR